MNLNNQIKKLLSYSSDEHPVISLYLKLGPNDRVNFKYKANLKNLIKGLRQALKEKKLSEAAVESFEKDITKLAKLIDDENKLSECRGICVFSNAKSRLWKVYKLPVVYRNQLVIDRSPLLGQLIKINDDYNNIVTVLIDRKKARIFRLEPDGCNEILDYFYPEASRTKKFKSTEGKFNQRLTPASGTGSLVQGYGEHSFHRTIDNEIHQHYKYIADKVFYAFNENKFDFLVLGGTEKNISEFSHHLHSYLQQRLVGTIRADVNKSKPSQVTEMTIETLKTFNAKKDKNILKEFEEKLRTRHAVNGLTPTLKALGRGQVKTLLVDESFSSPGFICPQTGVLALKKKKGVCPEGVEPIAVVDVVDDAIEEATRQKSEIEILRSKKIDGIGAILRFK